VKDVDFYFSLN